MMTHRNPFSTRGRRRLVNLGFQPLRQLTLPLGLLLITSAFCALFVIHTREAYGSLVDVGLREPWVRGLVDEIWSDFVVVSASIGAAYGVAVLGTCLAMMHWVFGPVVPLMRHLQRLQSGDYASRVKLRSGHPLSVVARELNALAERLSVERTAEADAGRGEAAAADAGEATPLDQVMRLYTDAASQPVAAAQQPAPPRWTA